MRIYQKAKPCPVCGGRIFHFADGRVECCCNRRSPNDPAPEDLPRLKAEARRLSRKNKSKTGGKAPPVSEEEFSRVAQEREGWYD